MDALGLGRRVAGGHGALGEPLELPADLADERVHPALKLLLGLGALEGGQRPARRERHDRGHRPDAQGLGDLGGLIGVGVRVDELKLRLAGELPERAAQALRVIAALAADLEHDRHLHRAPNDLGLEVLGRDLDDGAHLVGGPAGALRRSPAGLARLVAPRLGLGLEPGEVHPTAGCCHRFSF